MSFQGFRKGAEGSGQRVWDMKSHAEGWVPGFQCPKVSEERGAGSGPFLEGTGLEDVMLRGSVQSGRFEASGKVLEGSELGSASWL